MAFWIERGEEVEYAVRRIALEQINAAIEDIEDSDLDDHETVHEVRKRCKKIRGLVRLARSAFEDTYTAENAWFRNTARRLSDLRDATTLIEALDALTEAHEEVHDRGSFGSLRPILRRRRDEIGAELNLDERLEDSCATMIEARRRVGSWSLEERGFAAIAKGITKTYARARKAMERVSGDPAIDGFHEWRKRVKYHQYHCRLLKQLWPPVLDARADETHRLSDLLGDDRDLSLFRETLLAEPLRFGDAIEVHELIGLIDDCKSDLRKQSFALGRRLFA